MNIDKIDSNLSSGKKQKISGINYYSLPCDGFKVLGAYKTEVDGFFAYRMPKSVCVTKKLDWLSGCNAGVRVCFKTSSPILEIKVSLSGFGRTNMDSLHNSAGIDVMASKVGEGLKYISSIVPSYDDVFNEYNGKAASYSGSVDFGCDAEKTVVVCLPTESAVTGLEIGIMNGYNVVEANPYYFKTPIVFYGSSIVMGCCASKPSNNYPSIVSQLLNIDYINLGFAGNAQGEKEVAEYIATLKMPALVYDYDHNAPTVKHLQDTHEQFFKIIRAAQPNLPIIMLSRPIGESKECLTRKQIIKNTYLNAKKSGDNNVWFIDGTSILEGKSKEICKADGNHPNDLGLYKMAKAVSEILGYILKEKK